MLPQSGWHEGHSTTGPLTVYGMSPPMAGISPMIPQPVYCVHMMNVKRYVHCVNTR
jgi:hypothetical protein